MTPITVPGQAPAAARIPVLAKAGLAAGALVVSAGCWWLFSTREMTLKEFSEHTSTFGPGFRIHGTVKSIGYSDALAVGTNDGKGMKRLRLVDGEESASVWFDPERFDPLPEKGDRVTVTGDFQSILVVGIGTKTKRWTLGFAHSIETASDPAEKP